MRFLFTIWLFVFSVSLFAQLPPPCPSNTTMAADDCADACIYCNFNGLIIFNGDATPDIPAGGFCDDIENNVWLGFIASEVSLTFTVIPSSTTNGNGLQMGLYEDCGTLLACDMGVQGGGITPRSLTVNNLTLGQHYLLMIDGYEGDICAFTVVVSPPSSGVPLLGAPLSLDGPTRVCPNAVVEYCVPPVSGAAAYTWTGPPGSTINGMPSPVTLSGNTTGNCVTIRFGSASGPICVNAANSCFTGQPLCVPIVNAPMAPTILPDTVLCSTDDFPFVCPCGDVINYPGNCNCTYTTAGGCDSVVRQFVFVKPPIPTVLPPFAICGGDSVVVCDSAYINAGNYSVVCKDADGCDSLVNFTIIAPVLSAQINPVTLCEYPVTLSYTPSAGIPTWQKIGDSTIYHGSEYVAYTPGEYVLTLTFTVGAGSCSASDTIILPGSISLGDIAAISGPPTTCKTSIYSVDTLSGAAAYTWYAFGDALINGQQSPVKVDGQSGAEVQLRFPTNGMVNLCVQASNGCEFSNTACFDVEVAGMEFNEWTFEVCEEDLPFTLPWGEMVSDSGQYVNYATNVANCDSITRVDLVIVPIGEVDLGTIYLCSNEYLFLCGQTFSQTGSYELLCSDNAGCDTIYRFVIDNADLASVPSDTVNLVNGTAVLSAVFHNGAQYLWFGPNGQAVGQSSTIMVNQSGLYTLVVNRFSCTDTAYVQVVGISAQQEALLEENEVRLMPNVGSGFFQIQNEKRLLLESIRIFNAQSHLVFSENNPTQESQLTLDLTAQPSGVYVVSMLIEGKWWVGRVVRL